MATKTDDKRYGAAHCDEIIKMIDAIVPPEGEVKVIPKTRFPPHRRDT